MKKNEIILIGGGGHCLAVIDVIEKGNKYIVAGILDVKEKIGMEVGGYKIIGCDDDIAGLAKKHSNFIITVGQLKDNSSRVRMYQLVKKNNGDLPVIISPLAYVSKHAVIGEGTVVMHNAQVSAGAKVGVNAIINSFCLLEHDVTIGDHCHLSTRSTLNGNVTIGNNVFVGSSSVISNNLNVCDTVVIGAGSVIIKDIKEKGVYAGNPVRLIRSLK